MKKDFDRFRLFWGVLLGIAWAAIALILIRSGGKLTLEQLLAYEPEQPLQAALVMLGLFLLKSVDFVMHSGILYAANGVMFPLPAALALNLMGAAILVTPGYFIGRQLGGPVVAWLGEKLPKLRALAEIPQKSELAASLLLRSVGLPVPAVSLWLGAKGFGFGRYLAGSLLGLLPLLTSYTVLGLGAEDLTQPIFWLGLGFRVLVSLASFVISALLLRRRRPAPPKARGERQLSQAELSE